MSRRRRYSSGKTATGICERSGFEVPYKYLVKEPGTNLIVDKRMSDGFWNRVDHPQNYSPRDIVDVQRLRLTSGKDDFRFANCTLVYTRLLDETGRPLLTSTGSEGETIFDTFTKIAFNSLKKI